MNWIYFVHRKNDIIFVFQLGQTYLLCSVWLHVISVFCPGFQKGRVPSQKGTFSAVNGLSKGHFSAVNGLKMALLCGERTVKRAL